MQCIKQGEAQPFPCGQCLPCRINRRRLWASRILLESRKHEHTTFVTLTYADDKLPADMSLEPVDVQLWLKRFRKSLPYPVRFYLVGEYGDSTDRPHYHLALFGYEGCLYGKSRYSRFVKSCCPQCDLVRDSWQKGIIELTPLIPERAQYLAGYVTKKMTSKSDPRLCGRSPEFARMSLKPGIGAPSMSDLASLLTNGHASNLFDVVSGDVPRFLKSGSRTLTLGRYLRKRLENELELDNSLSGKVRREKISSENEYSQLRSLYETTGDTAAYFQSKGFEVDKETRLQKARNLEARFKINKKGRVI